MAGGVTAGTSQPDARAIAGQAHLSGLDSVRAFAALSVLFAHILGPSLPAMLLALGANPELSELSRYAFTGHPAVIVFFVVSGFCIHYPYTRRALPVAAFTAARWTRIMIPALVALLLAKLVHLHGFNFIDGYILWSIVCELWYYSLYPLFLLLSRRVPFEVQFVVAFLVSFLLVSFLGSDQYGRAHLFGPGLNWVVSLPSWLLGCLLANRVSGEHPSVRYGKRGIILWRMIVALAASCLYWLTMNTPIGYYLTMNTFAILVFFWIYAEINSYKNGASIFERVGKWSYSIYLFHMIFAVIAGKLLAGLHYNMLITLISIPMTLWLCHLAYRYVEQPSHEYARKLFNKYRDQYPGFSISRHAAYSTVPLATGKNR